MLLAGTCITDEKDEKTITYVFLAALSCIVVYGIYQYFWGLEETRRFIMDRPDLAKNLPPTYLSRMESDRIFSTFVYPNTLAGFLLLLYPVVFFFANSGKILQKITGLVILGLTVSCIGLTGSIGGLICLLLVSLLMLFYTVFPVKTFFRASVCILAIIAVVIFWDTGPTGFHTGILFQTGLTIGKPGYKYLKIIR